MPHGRTVDRLKRELSGYAALPGDAPYSKAVTIDNGRIDLEPALIVFPRSIADVGLALRFARDHEMPFTVKGGGHSAAGYCLNRGGVVLAMSSMADMHFDEASENLSVQMGARWATVYDHLEKTGTGYIPIGGGCLTVGLPGFLLGAGYSFVSRSYGMGCDNVRAIDFVTADGRSHRLSHDSGDQEDIDLFWACRGAGGGSFGVAVSMDLHVHRPRTPKMLMGEIYYPIEAAGEVLSEYNNWIETVPEQLAVYGYLGPIPNPGDPDPKKKTIKGLRLQPVYNGDFAEGVELIQPLLRHPLVSAGLYRMALPDWENFVGATTLVGDRQAYIRSGVMPAGGMTDDVVEIFQRFTRNAPSADSFVVWTNGGGKISAVGPDETAFLHRDGRFIFEVKAIWTDPADTRENVEWAYDYGEELRPFFKGAYCNYIDPLLSNWQEMYYGDNYRRLLDIKTRVDPENFFHFQQSVGSEFQPDTSKPLDLSPLNRTVVSV